MKHIICPDYIVAKQVSDALLEDSLAMPDWTAGLISTNKVVKASIKAKTDFVLCGIKWAEYAFFMCDNQVKIKWLYKDGDVVKNGAILCEIDGLASPMLTAERTALNFLQTLSATATQTHHYVNLIKHTKAQIMDTRKTIPGLRLAQKYAVTIGGGINQRVGLYDGVLIKENHIAACGGVSQALKHAASHIPAHIPIQIEVESFEQLVEALANKARLILLDNMSFELIEKCVEYTKGRAKLEVSGNVNLSNVAKYAATGVDRISIGALTKNIQAIDLSLRVSI